MSIVINAGRVTVETRGQTMLGKQVRVGLAFRLARRLKYDLRVWCDSCLRWLPHRWEGPGHCCPRLHDPEVRCVCGIHTCFDGRALGDETEPEKSRLVYYD